MECLCDCFSTSLVLISRNNTILYCLFFFSFSFPLSHLGLCNFIVWHFLPDTGTDLLVPCTTHLWSHHHLSGAFIFVLVFFPDFSQQLLQFQPYGVYNVILICQPLQFAHSFKGKNNRPHCLCWPRGPHLEVIQITYAFSFNCPYLFFLLIFVAVIVCA